MVIFYSYISLPEGNVGYWWILMDIDGYCGYSVKWGSWKIGIMMIMNYNSMGIYGNMTYDYSYVKSCFWVLKRRMSCVMLGLACGGLWFVVADPRVFRSMKRLLGRTYAEAHEIGLRPSDLGADPAGYVGLPEDQVDLSLIGQDWFH